MPDSVAFNRQAPPLYGAPAADPKGSAENAFSTAPCPGGLRHDPQDRDPGKASQNRVFPHSPGRERRPHSPCHVPMERHNFRSQRAKTALRDLLRQHIFKKLGTKRVPGKAPLHHWNCRHTFPAALSSSFLRNKKLFSPDSFPLEKNYTAF